MYSSIRSFSMSHLMTTSLYPNKGIRARLGLCERLIKLARSQLRVACLISNRLHRSNLHPNHDRRQNHQLAANLRWSSFSSLSSFWFGVQLLVLF